MEVINMKISYSYDEFLAKYLPSEYKREAEKQTSFLTGMQISQLALKKMDLKKNKKQPKNHPKLSKGSS